jgi:hypothetical protein
MAVRKSAFKRMPEQGIIVNFLCRDGYAKLFLLVTLLHHLTFKMGPTRVAHI